MTCHDYTYASPVEVDAGASWWDLSTNDPSVLKMAVLSKMIFVTGDLNSTFALLSSRGGNRLLLGGY